MSGKLQQIGKGFKNLAITIKWLLVGIICIVTLYVWGATTISVFACLMQDLPSSRVSRLHAVDGSCGGYRLQGQAHDGQGPSFAIEKQSSIGTNSPRDCVKNPTDIKDVWLFIAISAIAAYLLLLAAALAKTPKNTVKSLQRLYGLTLGFALFIQFWVAAPFYYECFTGQLIYEHAQIQFIITLSCQIAFTAIMWPILKLIRLARDRATLA